MKKLNNKGITTVEVIICFTLVVIITMSIYKSISAYNEKRIIEDYKTKVITYKNILTKDIQDDFIKIGISYAIYDDPTKTLVCEMKDGSQRKLIVNASTSAPLIQYGKVTATTNDVMDYPLPDLGTTGSEKDLKISSVNISLANNIVTIDIAFQHQDLTTNTDQYGIHIVCPIDYSANSNPQNLNLD